MLKKIALAASLLIAAGAASATEPGHWYAGGDFGSTKLSGESHRETGYGAFGGYQFTDMIAVEGNLRRIADNDETFVGVNYSTKVNQIAVSAIGTLPLSSGFSVFGRLGINRISQDTTGGGDSFKDHAVRGLYGIGVAYNFTPAVAMRLELQKPHSDLTSLNAGLSFSF
ncbi:MAG: porin family protein [Massilia sp.]